MVAAAPVAELELASQSDQEFLTRENQDETFPDTKKGNRGQNRKASKKKASEPKATVKKRPAAKQVPIEVEAPPAEKTWATAQGCG